MVWSWLYDTKSFLQEGTLCHLRNLIDRRNISATAADDFNACEDFFVTVVHSHIVAATMDYLQMKTVKDTPIHPVLKEGIWLESDDERRDALDVISKEIPYSLKFSWRVNFVVFVVMGLPTKFKPRKSLKCHPLTGYVNCQPRKLNHELPH